MSRVCALMLWSAVAGVFGTVAGCGPKTPPATEESHDHEHAHQHPTTLAGCVAEIAKLRDTIRTGFEEKNPEKAHEPLHEIGHLLEDVPELAAKQDPAPDSSAVKETADELFDLFAKVDEKLHGAEGAEYSEVSVQIDAAIKRLQQMVASPSAPPTAETAPAEIPATPTAETTAP